MTNRITEVAALAAIVTAQRAGGIAGVIDVEHTFDINYAQVLGVDTEKLLVSQPDNGEQALEIAEALVRSGAFNLVVFSSVTSELTKKVAEEAKRTNTTLLASK